jgi:hypothetical protein
MIIKKKLIVQKCKTAYAQKQNYFLKVNLAKHLDAAVCFKGHN